MTIETTERAERSIEQSPRYPENENKRRFHPSSKTPYRLTGWTASQKWAYFKHVRQSYEYSQQALAQSDRHLAEQAERQRESTKKLDEIKIQLSSLDKEYKTMVTS
jgi:chromosome segregation ATPase